MPRPDDSSAVYIDDRVKVERWVRRNSVDQHGLLADEPPELKQNVVTLLNVCKQSKFLAVPPYTTQRDSLTGHSLSMSLSQVICSGNS